MSMQRSHVFGPVLSGRLGRSLGLDLLGAPVCSMDCLYCEVGPTTALTTRRKAYVPAPQLLAELARWKNDVGGAIDVVTLGGMGEPTLNSDLAAIIAGARAILPGVPVAVLTNAASLTDPQVRAELLGADMVLPSMDSLVEEEFRKLCRPAPGISAAAVAQGIEEFRAAYSGRLYLEVLLIAGINDTDANLGRLEDFAARLRPHRVDVVTLSRPGAYAEAKAVDPATLDRFQQALDRAAGLERTRPEGRNPPESPPESPASALTAGAIRVKVLDSVRRRPQTLGELAAALELPPARVAEVVLDLERQGILRATGPEPHYGPVRQP